MENNHYALVLTGSVLHGHDADTVWPALAHYFRMDSARLAQLRTRAPLTIKQSGDLGKLQALQSGIAALGAEAELCAPDGRADLFVLLDNAPCGPLPRVFVEQRIDEGTWPGELRVAPVGTQTWTPYTGLASAAAAATASLPGADEHDADGHGDTETQALAAEERETRLSAPLALEELAAEESAIGASALPPGAALHAGFWRRCAALIMDGVLIGIAVSIVQVLLGIGAIGALSANRPGAMVGVVALTALMVFLGQWLYFALFESGARQATPGKMALGIKVVDESGRRITFGRASGRYFGKILSGLILNLGYLMAGWTSRKQALHDLLAGTLVVFREVDHDAPLPTLRPPMPWYGWLLNAVLVLAMCGVFLLAATTWQLAISTLQGASGF